jgi:hypothetical protein
MKIFCIVCKRETNHDVLKEEKRKIFDDDAQVGFYDEWQIIQCKGCDDISFRHMSYNSDDVEPENGSPYLAIKLYPLRGRDILPIKGFYNAPLSVRNIYRETIDAYNNGLYLLCAGGLRATIESICNAQLIVDGPVDKTKPGGPLKIVRSNDLIGKINGLHEKGLIIKNQTEILHEHRYLGNDALHSLDIPSKKSLRIAIEIIEHILDSLYEISDKAEELIWQREKRQKKKKK